VKTKGGLTSRSANAKKFYREECAKFEERVLFKMSEQEQKMKGWSVSDLLVNFLSLDHVSCVDRSTPLIEYLGNISIFSLTATEVKAYRSWRAKQKARRNQSVCEHNVKPATINREVALLRQAYNEFNIQPNPCKGIKPFKEPPRDRVLTQQEFNHLQSELSGDALDIITIAYYTGMRKGEIMDMDAERIDYTNGYFSLRAEDTKNGEARKVPFMSAEVYDIFQRRERKIYGKLFSAKCIRTTFEGACRRIGLEDFRFHDLRHTAATNMRVAGIDTPTVMKICGWKSVAMFLTYQNVGDEDLEKASVALASVEEEPPQINVRKFLR
jgi:integrase